MIAAGELVAAKAAVETVEVVGWVGVRVAAVQAGARAAAVRAAAVTAQESQ